MLRVIERNLITIVGFRPEHGFIDWAAKSITQPAILPCRPSAPVPPGEDPWGGISPRVFVDVSLPALDPGDLPTATRAKGLSLKPARGPQCLRCAFPLPPLPASCLPSLCMPAPAIGRKGRPGRRAGPAEGVRGGVRGGPGSPARLTSLPDCPPGSAPRSV